MSNKYHYFYKITNNINGHYYYGVHNTNNLGDGYMGSGLKLQDAFDKYGIENFSKEIIKMFDTTKEAFEYENQIVTEELVNSKECYNIACGGRGGDLYDYYVTIKNKNGNIECVRKSDAPDNAEIIYNGYSRSDSNKKDISNGVLKYYNTEEEKLRKEEIKKDRRRYWDSEEGMEMREKLSKMNKEYYQTEKGKDCIKRHIEQFKGRPVSQEHRDKQSKSITKFWNSDAGKEIRDRWKTTMTGKNAPNYGKGRRYDVIDTRADEVVLHNACSCDIKKFWNDPTDPSWYYRTGCKYKHIYKVVLSKG